MSIKPDSDLGGFERRLGDALALLDAERLPVTLSRRSRARRALPIAAAVAIVPLLAAGAYAVFSDPNAIQVAGDTAVAGGEIVAKGVGCAPGGDVSYSLDGTAIGGTQAGDEGYFAAQVTIPAGTSEGTHDLKIACDTPDGGPLVERIAIHVVKELPPIAPTFATGGSASPGSLTGFKGAGCRPGTTVSIRLDENSLGSYTVEERGTFVAMVTIPSTTTLGEHTVSAYCLAPDASQLNQQAMLTVVAPETVPPGSK